jgi:hypothetical protein
MLEVRPVNGRSGAEFAFQRHRVRGGDRLVIVR